MSNDDDDDDWRFVSWDARNTQTSKTTLNKTEIASKDDIIPGVTPGGLLVIFRRGRHDANITDEQSVLEP